MPAAPAYTDLSTVRAYMGLVASNTTLDGVISQLLLPVSRAIDNYTHRHFWAKTATKTYDWQSGFRLAVDDDLLSVTTLYNGDGTVIPPQNYILYPLQGPPYRYIDLNRAYGSTFFWSSTPQAALKVTGVFGYLDPDSGLVPGEVALAASIWIKYIITERDSSGAVLQRAEDFEVDYDRLTMMLITPPGSVAALLGSYINREYTTFTNSPSARGV